MNRCLSRLSLKLLLTGILVPPLALAQQQQPSDDLKKDMETLKEGIKSLQKDVQEIKTLLKSRQPPAPPSQNVVLDLGKNPFKGQRTAKLTLVEISDYQ